MFGNIAIWQTNSMRMNGTNAVYELFNQGFKYDKINRLKHSNSYVGSPAVGDNYKTSYNYDPNGNITNLSRFDGTGGQFDNLSYNYTNGSNDNKLTQITDAVTPSPSSYVGDLETQSNANNYEYDASGNLTKDVSENISSIEWTPDGKIKKITKTPNVVIDYLYDAMGQRVTKNVTTTTAVIPPPIPPAPQYTVNRKQTIYARDANGQVMAIYEREFNPNEPNNPDPKLKFRLKMEWITHGCEFDIEIVEGVDFTFDGLNIVINSDKYYSLNCFEHSFSFMLSAGTTINLAIVNDPILGNNVILGYRQPNLTGKYSNGMPKFFTAILDGNPVSLKINSISSKVTYANPSFLPKVAEWHVYGNEQQGRFLTKYPEQEPTYYGQGITEDIRNGIFSRQLGKKAYELKDHLGNVRVTFSDVKMPTIQTAPPYNRTAPYSVDLLSKSEYFPYGMKINELSFNPTGARYGYNGKEKDNEIKGESNSLDFGERIYDPRVSRFLSQDPLKGQFAFQSPFIYAGNSPINSIDVNGLFKLSAENQEIYPRLTEVLKNLPKLITNKKIAEKLFEKFTFWTGGTKEDLIKELTFGEGSEIVPTDPCDFSPTPVFGEYDRVNLGRIKVSTDLLEQFENADNKTDFNNLQFGVVGTVLHEGGHKVEFEVDGKNNNPPASQNDALIRSMFSIGLEEGEGLERQLFGRSTPGQEIYNPLKFSEDFGVQLNKQKENINYIVVPYKANTEIKTDDKKTN